MSTAIYNEMAAGMNLLNTELTNAFARDGIRCFLLRRGENSGSLNSIREVENGFFSVWNAYREQTQFEFATTDETFADDFAQATHIGYGVPDDDGEIEVFEISADARDRITPDGVSPFFKAFAGKDGAERFTVS
jgi:hypothetical protein